MNNDITGTQKGYSSIFKAKIALLALKETNLFDLAHRFNLNEALVRCWKEELLESLEDTSENSHETQTSEIISPRAIYTQGPTDFTLSSFARSSSNENILSSPVFEEGSFLKSRKK